MTLASVTNLGNTYLAMERYEDAARMFETSLPLKRRMLGLQHPWTGIAMSGLAEAYLKLGRRDDANPILRELMDYNIASAERSNARPVYLNNVAWLLLTHEIEELRDPQRALEFAQRACEAEENADGENLWSCLDTLALAQHQAGHHAAAVEIQQRVLALMPPGTEVGAQQRLAEYQAALAEDLSRGSHARADSPTTDGVTDDQN